MSGSFKACIEHVLDVFPDAKAVGFENFTTAYRRIIDEVRLGDYIEVPSRVVLVTGCDDGLIVGHGRAPAFSVSG